MSDVLEGLDTIVEAPTLPEAEVNVDPPADKHDVRDEKGQFSPKDGKKEPEQKTEENTEEKVIPIAAHARERAEWKQERDRWAAEKKALEERLSKLEAPPKPAAPEPEFQADPKAYVDHRVQSALETLNKQVETGTKTAEQARAEAEDTRFTMVLQTTEAEFRAANPDYYEALTHLRTLRANELMTLHPDATQEQVIAFMQQEERHLARQMLMSGRNPHEVAYRLAKARGYAAKAPDVKLPEVPKAKQLEPDMTLGTGAGAPGNASDTTIDDENAVEIALAQVFGRKKAS